MEGKGKGGRERQRYGAEKEAVGDRETYTERGSWRQTERH